MNLADRFILGVDLALRTVVGPAMAGRPSPGAGEAEHPLSDSDRRHSAALMRVNHAGEICAQALYQGQAIMSRDARLAMDLARAAREEVDHLAWIESRLVELGGRRSALVPLWYGGALGIGLLAGLAGDRWNLAFLAETERQVGEHLGGHLTRLPAADAKSREIVAQMRRDELAHAEMAIGLGGVGLPLPVRWAMRAAARVMTGVAYRL